MRVCAHACVYRCVCARLSLSLARSFSLYTLSLSLSLKHTHTHTHTHAHTHTRTHTHTHTHTQVIMSEVALIRGSLATLQQRTEAPEYFHTTPPHNINTQRHQCPESATQPVEHLSSLKVSLSLPPSLFLSLSLSSFLSLSFSFYPCLSVCMSAACRWVLDA